MLATQQKQLEERIEVLVKEGKLNNKEIYVFGSNEPAERIIDEMIKYSLVVRSMLDNNEKKKVFSYKGVSVSLPSEAMLPVKENAVILIASKYFDEMTLQLENMGYCREQIYQVVVMETGSVYSLDDATWKTEEEKLRHGLDVIKRLQNAYGEDVRIFIFPWQAIGDIYMAGRYLKAYIEKIEKEKSLKPGTLNYVITVMGNVRKKVAMTCGYEKIEVLLPEESKNLCRAVVFLGYKETNAEILQHRFSYTNRIWKLGNYKKINFDDHFRYSIYGLSEDSPVVVPNQRKDQEAIDKIFAENQLIPGKTAIIAPYANTIANPSPEFWEKLVEELKNAGYTVCTNSGGAEEPAIKGTLPVLFPFDITISAIEHAGCFIGLRSGLCDYVAAAKAKKIILYPDRIYVNGPVIDFYSLNVMGLCEDAVEFVYNEKNPEETLVNVVTSVTE